MRTAATVLTCTIVVSLLFQAPDLAAQERRGADLIVTKLDGTRVAGELIAVKSDSLLLLRSGDVLTVPRHKIRSVTLMRRSQMASGALKGFVFGALPGVAWGISYGDSGTHGIRTPVKAGAFCGVLGLAIGMAVSRGEKAESIIPFAGVDGPAADDNWNALRAHSREGRR